MAVVISPLRQLQETHFDFLGSVGLRPPPHPGSVFHSPHSLRRLQVCKNYGRVMAPLPSVQRLQGFYFAASRISSGLLVI